VRGTGRSAWEPEDSEHGVEDEEHEEGAQWHPLWVSGDDDDDDVEEDDDDDVEDEKHQEGAQWHPLWVSGEKISISRNPEKDFMRLLPYWKRNNFLLILPSKPADQGLCRRNCKWTSIGGTNRSISFLLLDFFKNIISEMPFSKMSYFNYVHNPCVASILSIWCYIWHFYPSSSNSS